MRYQQAADKIFWAVSAEAIMDKVDNRLADAIEDNVRWCRLVCRAHRFDERLSDTVWVNRLPSPRFYPNIITRGPGMQAAVAAAIEELRDHGLAAGWGIKDSFADLDLRDLGFRPVVAAHWYVRASIDAPHARATGWTRVREATELQRWEDAWNGGSAPADEERTFPAALLNESGVGFWQNGLTGPAFAGFVSHENEAGIGLSNWFSAADRAETVRRAAEAAARLFPGHPVYFWSETSVVWQHVSALGPLTVWIAED